MDDYSREDLVLVADTSLSGHRVVREMDRVIDERSIPKTIVSDTSYARNNWLFWHQAFVVFRVLDTLKYVSVWRFGQRKFLP